MKLIVGLGNPGAQYRNTRHNLGFRIVEALVANFDAKWAKKSKLRAEVAEGRIGREKVVVIKPATFMNLSGDAVAAVSNMYKTAPEDVWIVHDDIDLAFGKVKIQRGRSSAGHRGVEHIIQVLGTKDALRFRIGIDSRTDKQKKQDTDRFVLSAFSRDDEHTLLSLIPAIAGLIVQAIQTSPEKAMSIWGNQKKNSSHL